ncbi:U-box domain-containing protein 8 [Raphanus sativus]|uniref:RING-type E3 ubiquitin transferase n=1 Tax=Raphanus sativus TaxID=3726 RepID=A0A6J0MIA3_RAPSA|nr:U-box domain-containing protein 8 [Raphanus sativus]KAJ4912804.1 U-box domain-containing protein 8 [Raphanus sativus]
MAFDLPNDFRCPISLEIMSDPVIIQSGHTFDRVSIQKWIDSGNRTCPITKLPLSENPSLIPNHALRSLISNFAHVSPKQHQDHHSQSHSLISALVSRSSSHESRLESLTRLVRLTKRDSSVRRKVTESGAVRAVLDCVDSGDMVLQEKSLSLLLNLSLEDDNKVGLVADGVVRRVVAVLRVGSPDCKAVAATLLTSLAVVEVNKATIGSYPDAISALVSLLRDGNERERKESATALYALCSFPDNRKRVVDCGSVGILVEAADSGLERAVEVLGLLVKCRGGREEMSRVSGFVEVLVNVLRNGSLKGIQYSLFILNCLCCCSREIVDEVKREGVVEICFGLEDNESEKIRRNATNLVHTLLGNPMDS